MRLDGIRDLRQILPDAEQAQLVELTYLYHWAPEAAAALTPTRIRWWVERSIKLLKSLRPRQ